MLFIKCLFSKFSGTYVQQEDYNDDRWSTSAQQLRFKEAYIDRIDHLALYNTFLVQYGYRIRGYIDRGKYVNLTC